MGRRRTPGFTAFAITVAVLAGCATSGTPASTVSTAMPSPVASSSARSATPEEVGSPSAGATSTDSEQEEKALTPDEVAQVVTTDLVVRSLPGISDASEILEPLIDEPTLLYLVDGPVAANGYDWYQVQPFGMHYLDLMRGQPPFGWVAAGSREGEPWIAPSTLECPEPEIEAIRAMTAIARLACYGAQELTLDGAFGGCFVADPAIGTPEWLFQTGCTLVPDGYTAGAVVPDPGGLVMRFKGEVGIPYDEPDGLITVTGHFGDPAAATCEVHGTSGDGAGSIEPMDPAEAVLYCRAQFVVTRVELSDG